MWIRQTAEAPAPGQSRTFVPLRASSLRCRHHFNWGRAAIANGTLEYSWPPVSAPDSATQSLWQWVRILLLRSRRPKQGSLRSVTANGPARRAALRLDRAGNRKARRNSRYPQGHSHRTPATSRHRSPAHRTRHHLACETSSPSGRLPSRKPGGRPPPQTAPCRYHCPEVAAIEAGIGL